MTPARHPSPQTLALYATGEMPTAPALVVDAHLDACLACAALVRAIEAAEGRLMASLPDAPMGSDALARTLSRLETPPGVSTASAPVRLGDVALPPALAAVGVRPRRWLRPGFWAARARLPVTDGWRLALLRAPAGARIPWHSHLGEELTVVLSGRLRDGAALGPGDFAEHRGDDGHAVAVGDEGACACLVAVRHGARWRGPSALPAAWLGL